MPKGAPLGVLLARVTLFLCRKSKASLLAWLSLLIEIQDAGMLTSNANSSSPTMSHALEQTKGARIGVICKSASSKLSASCLHGYTVSMQKIQGFLFWKSIFAIPPIVAAATIHTLPWKMRIETCPLSAPCTHESKSIDVYTAIHARGSRKVQ